MSLPQLPMLAALQGALGVPVQIGGSFARGEADAVSDLDLTFEPSANWSIESLDQLLIAVLQVPLGPRTLFHGVARDGTVVDLLPGPPLPGAVDAREFASPTRREFPSYPLETGLLAEFWIHTHKHAKPLARDLDAMAILGLAHDRTFLIRLWTVADGGEDPGPSLSGIHAMSPLIRRVITPERQALLGAPVRTREEIVRTIRAIRDEVTGLGLTGAQRIERVVRNSPLV